MFAPLAGASGLSSSATIRSRDLVRASGRDEARDWPDAASAVSTAPGLTQMALIPCALPSTAIASVRPMTPYLETL